MRRGLALVAALLPLGLAPSGVQAKIPDDKIRIGVLDEAAGPDAGTPEGAAVTAVGMAEEQFGRYPGPIDVETLHASHRTDPDADVRTVRDWLAHEDVAFVIDVGAAAEAARLASLLGRRDRLLVLVGGSADEAGPLCAPTVLKWGATPATMARAMAAGLASLGHHRIAAIAEPTPYSAALDTDRPAALRAADLAPAGATILEEAGARDPRHALLAARTSNADATVLLLTGNDLRQSLQAASMLGWPTGNVLAAPAATDEDVSDVGLSVASGLLVVSTFDPNGSKAAARFARLFAGRALHRFPREDEADAYAATIALLDAARAAGSIDADAILRAMRAHGAADPFDGRIAIRQDGFAMRPAVLFRVERPEEGSRPGSFLTRVRALSASSIVPPACARQPGTPSGAPGRNMGQQ